MKVKMSKILDLEKIYPSLKEQVLPIKLTYKISKFFSKVNEESDFYTDELTKIVAEFSVKDENGNPQYTEDKEGIKINPDFTQIAQVRVNELLNLEVELPDVTFKLDELNDIKLSIEEFNILLPFVEE